ncbi:hypothetical protein TIFTF001_006019 [Ficus carica]|uniref:Phytocyanin domain-containing protein n=1 Tax=Ficus carica TaxID=3494 RepID=A0AA87ZN23_FICCA|nr:hypothetical protein TIFTF001_006019 [Ficus carica]
MTGGVMTVVGLAVVLVAVSLGGKSARGFTYSAAQGSVAELGSRKEYEACDLSKPIRMFTDGLDAISLEMEGIRYFVSSSSEHCKNGLKLHVEVLPKHNYPGAGILQVTASEEHQAIAQAQAQAQAQARATAADGPTSPSGSAHLGASPVLLGFGLLGLFITTGAVAITALCCRCWGCTVDRLMAGWDPGSKGKARASLRRGSRRRWPHRSVLRPSSSPVAIAGPWVVRD